MIERMTAAVLAASLGVLAGPAQAQAQPMPAPPQASCQAGGAGYFEFPQYPGGGLLTIGLFKSPTHVMIHSPGPPQGPQANYSANIKAILPGGQEHVFAFDRPGTYIVEAIRIEAGTVPVPNKVVGCISVVR